MQIFIHTDKTLYPPGQKVLSQVLSCDCCIDITQQWHLIHYLREFFILSPLDLIAILMDYYWTYYEKRPLKNSEYNTGIL